ncbi:MAG TPA: aldo/keto reductase [Nevskiaceae bacterium]|nr:aldo/keto reductase [Nevskiaceae bacterium]
MTGSNVAAAGDFKLGGELAIHRLGYGAMRVTGKGVWGEPDDRPRCLKTLRHIREVGINFIDTADAYGPAVSEPMLREALHPYGDIVIATKGGQVRTGPDQWIPIGNPDYLLQEVKMSLRWLGLEQIPLWQLHRIDRKVPRDEQFGAMRQMLDQGLIRYAGLSEVDVEDIEAARKLFPVATVQNRYSANYRKHEKVLEYCEREGIGFIPWYPLSGGQLSRPDSPLAKIAKAHGATPAQVSIAWLLRRSPVIIPIPGTTRVEHLEENAAAASIELSDAEYASLGKLA